MSIDFIILAAGKGTRMKSQTPKVLHEIAGKPIVEYIVDVFNEIKTSDEKIITVVNNEIEYSNSISSAIKVIQKNQLGTADAVLSALPYVTAEYVVISCGDMPLITKDHLSELLNSNADATIIAAVLPDDKLHMPYGRIITDNDSKFSKIVEFKDSTEQERNSKLFNTGVYKIRTDTLKQYINKIQKNSLSGEFYLTDIFEILQTHKYCIEIIKSNDYQVFHGINTMIDLSYAEQVMQDRLRNKFMLQGVKMNDPKTVCLSYDTEIESNVQIEQNVILKEGVKIKNGAKILAFSYLENCTIEESAEIGPFARVRGNTVIGQNSSIGNFVEVKGSVFGNNSKAKHLSYIGDTSIAENVNIGAGTITCNYDGFSKHKTRIESGAFVGSNTTIIAPNVIGKNAIIAAGSVITQDVPVDSLAIARVTQSNIKDKASEIRKRKKKD
ncbi:MAG: bifunctional UDP-N-acetylglucosamine diphosphorylase/glucosamine-1-phosphate N-acetyltransferase GlmU [Alphaproteobacteria bacterium]|nr:bifunctional UDP-N-acetylglucosamine diphosphorylase/glucosamine-1-phosphate N-acetyltransferase GlmU [Alphaproteobacteria bacterium]